MRGKNFLKSKIKKKKSEGQGHVSRPGSGLGFVLNSELNSHSPLSTMCQLLQLGLDVATVSASGLAMSSGKLRRPSVVRGRGTFDRGQGGLCAI